MTIQWNTYGDPPNSDLLRRYGHVDVVSLRPPLAGEGNPADVVEIRADVVVETVSVRIKGNNIQDRVDWWLEIADDELVTYHFIPLKTDFNVTSQCVCR